MGYSKHHDSFNDKLSESYGYLYVSNSINFVLYYIQINVIHIVFEAILTVLYVAPMVVYSDIYCIENDLELSYFFSRVMLTCANVFLIVTVGYILFLLICCYAAIALRKLNAQNGRECLSFIIIAGILGGILTYTIAGITVSINPSSVAGLELPPPSLRQQNLIIFWIIESGMVWAIQSTFRFLRINWQDAMPHTQKIYSNNLNTIILYNNTQKMLNKDALRYRCIGTIVQGIGFCFIVLHLISAIKEIPYVENNGSDFFNYYNLILLVYFTVVSSYITTITKLEIVGNHPGFNICTDM